MSKTAILFSALLFYALASYGQHNLQTACTLLWQKEKTDTGKAIILYHFSSAYQIFKPDSALLLAQEAYSLSTKNEFLKGQSWALNQMAGAFNRLGNYTEALQYYIRQLKIEEQRGYADNIAIIDMNIALVYNSERDEDKALYYAHEADSIITTNNLSDLALYSLLNLGEITARANKLPLALSYTLDCYKQSLNTKDSLITGTALNNLGNIYSKMGDQNQAITSYKASIPYLKSMNDNNTLSECTLGLAKALEKSDRQDSARYYAMQSYDLSYRNGFLDPALDASSFISQLYKKEKKFDSAFFYHEIMFTIKDSIESTEKIKQLESITIAEQLRQTQIAEQLEQEKQNRLEKLQFLAIGIMIPIFFLLSLYISRKKVHAKIIEFSGIVSLLLLFEYITLLIHPVIVEKTNNSPILEIIIFVAIAALITPTHHRIETWLISRLTKRREKHEEGDSASETIA